MYHINSISCFSLPMLFTLLFFAVAAIVATVAATGRARGKWNDNCQWAFVLFVITLLTLPARIAFPLLPTIVFRSYIVYLWSVACCGLVLSHSKLFQLNTTRIRSGSYVVVWLWVVSLVSLWLPGSYEVREATNVTSCKSNLKIVYSAFKQQEDEFGNSILHPHGTPMISWRVVLLPFLQENVLHSEYDSSSKWTSSVNTGVAQKKVPYYCCPSRQQRGDEKLIKDQFGRFFTQYATLTGPGTFGTPESSGPLGRVGSQVMIAESCGLDIVWTDVRDIDTEMQPNGVNLPSRIAGTSPGWLSSHHGGGAFVLMNDGRVELISEKVDSRTLEATVKGR